MNDQVSVFPAPGTGMGDRQREFIQLVRQRGYVSIEAMAARFRVSTQTIRRDIKQLLDRKLLARHHGGAGLPPGEDTLAYTNRRVRNAEQKEKIGKLVAANIPNGASLFIDIGTTTEAVATGLVGHRNLRVVTNHIGVAAILSERTDFEIILAGGTVRKRDQAVTGETAVEFLQRYKVTYGVFGIGTIDEDGVPAELVSADYLGADSIVTARIGPQELVVRMPGYAKINGGERVNLTWPKHALHVFDAATGERATG